MKSRGICKFANVPPDKAGRLTMRKDHRYPCRAPDPPQPDIPASMSKSYGFRWPPHRQLIGKEECADCPCWTPREQKEE